MNKEKRRVPKLRFPGFTEDWEQRKLGEYANFRRGSFPQPYGNKEWYDGVGSAPFVQVVDVGDNLSLVDCTKQRISKLAQPMSVYAEKGSVLVTLQGSIGRVAVSQYDAFIDRTILIFQGYKYKTNSYFWAYIIKNKFSEEALKAPGGTIKTITKEALSNFIILYPKFSEQEQIGLFFEKLDKLITLHQRKLEHLNLKKKALLQKLFPKNGERYPEIRFPGFTDAWEQRKLNEFLSVSNFKNTDNKYNKNNVLSVSGDYGIVNQIEFQGRSFAGVSVSNYGVVETGDIVYTKSPLKLNPYGIIKANRINAGIVSTLYAIYKTKKNCDSKFIEHYFNLDSRLNKYLKPLVNKGAKNDMKVSSENALIGEVCFPHVTEQKLIADFLDRLGLFITLHQRKLEHLQLQKKALLQQMFV